MTIKLVVDVDLPLLYITTSYSCMNGEIIMDEVFGLEKGSSM